jgi:hypothetical protein
MGNKFLAVITIATLVLLMLSVGKALKEIGERELQVVTASTDE